METGTINQHDLLAGSLNETEHLLEIEIAWVSAAGGALKYRQQCRYWPIDAARTVEGRSAHSLARPSVCL